MANRTMTEAEFERIWFQSHGDDLAALNYARDRIRTLSSKLLHTQEALSAERAQKKEIGERLLSTEGKLDKLQGELEWGQKLRRDQNEAINKRDIALDEMESRLDSVRAWAEDHHDSLFEDDKAELLALLVETPSPEHDPAWGGGDPLRGHKPQSVERQQRFKCYCGGEFFNFDDWERHRREAGHDHGDMI